MKIITKKLSALSLTAILLLAGCGSYQGNIQGNIDLVPDPVQTSATTTEVTTPAPLKLGDRLGGCFVASDPEVSPFLVEFHSSYNCIPGYLYFEKEVYGEHMLLLAKECKFITDQTAITVWVVSKDNELLKVSKYDGSYEVLYSAQYGEISGCLDSYRDGEQYGRLLYIQDGSCIVQMESETGEYSTPVRSDNGISWYAGIGAIEKSQKYHEEAYICEDCGYGGDYILWADNDYNYFWYHPETGENEPVVMGEGADLYFLQIN